MVAGNGFQEPASWTNDLNLSADGQRAKETFYNFTVILENDEAFEGKFRFDEFLNKAMFDDYPVSDVVESDILAHLCREYGFGGNQPKTLTRAIQQVANLSRYDSLIEWIRGLPAWDQTPRLSRWLVDWCGAEESAYTDWMGYATIMQMTARAMSPGCMARFVPVFEGPEGVGKTRAIRVLGSPWTRTFDMSMDSKEAHMAIQGIWLAELAELDTLRKTTETRLKSFISQTEDAYIPKYANNAVIYPRRTMFIGTTNEETYLPGTGNTRFLPIKTPAFNLEALTNNRDQLIAEARDILLHNPTIKWWEPPDSVHDEVKAARESRRLINVYEAELSRWLDGDGGGKSYDRVTWKEIAKSFLGMDSPEHWKDQGLQKQIAQALKALGWVNSVQKINKKSTRCWIRGS